MVFRELVQIGIGRWTGDMPHSTQKRCPPVKQHCPLRLTLAPLTRISSVFDAMGVPVTTQACLRHRELLVAAAAEFVLATIWASSSTSRQKPHLSSGDLRRTRTCQRESAEDPIML